MAGSVVFYVISACKYLTTLTSKINDAVKNAKKNKNILGFICFQ